MDKIYTTNVRSTVLFSKYFAKQVIQNKSRGCIINISSVSGQEASSDAMYGLSKAAII
jgi:3-oxoacyl-[acyl-carrier protein] reductase